MIVNGHPLIEVIPGVCGGRPVIRGTRMRVTDILGALAVGDTAEEILEDFPYIKREDIMACLAYGAETSAQPFAQAAE